MKTVKTMLSMTLLVGFLSGCSLLPSNEGAAGPQSDTSPTSPPASSQSNASPFGLGYAYENVEFALDIPQVFTPSATAAGVNPGDRTVSVRVVLANIGAETFDPSLFMVTASADGKECSSIFDSPNKIGRAPMTPVLSGAGAEWVQAFSCPAGKGASFVVAATPGIGYQDAMFEGTLP